MRSSLAFKLSLLCLFLTGCHWGNQHQSSSPDVKVLPVKRLIGPYEKSFIGVLKPVNQVTLRARVEGFLDKRLFKEGGFVQKDELLFTIDKKPFEAQLLSAKGALEQAKANLTFQEIQFKRYQKLVVHQNIAKAQYDQQYAQYLEALGQLDTAQGNYDQALLNLGYCSVIAPMSGQVGKAYVDVGNLVSGANKTELVKLIQLDPLRVEFNPSAADIRTFLEYKQNRPFHVEVSLPKLKKAIGDGIVDFYDNTMNLGTSTLLLRTTIFNKDLILRPDLYVNVKVTLDPKHHFMLVPYTLITDVQGVQQILVVNKDHKIYWRTLKLGRMVKDEVEIEQGIEKGDMIVFDQNLPLSEGTKVNPQQSKV